ncbi:MAG: DUF721 domain-containing protein [Vicinamibacterales bacterium]
MQPLRDAMPRAVAALIRDAPLSPGKTDFAWRVAVGPTVHRHTHVRLGGGVLHVDASTPQWADEVRRSSRVILARMQTLLGETAIGRLQVTP